MNIYICGRLEVDNFKNKAITNIIGIEDPNTPKLELPWINETIQYNRVFLYDTSTDPKIEHIRDLLRIYSFISPTNILFHCAQGANRSPAAAYIFLCYKGISPPEALKKVAEARPWGVGNETMIKLASKELNNPAIYKNWQDKFGGKPKW